MKKTLLQAIAAMEGFYKLGSRPARNHNPGDLEYHAWQQPYGAVLETVPAGERARFAVFPSDDQGFAAMRALLGFPAYCGKTVLAALNEWAPPVENNVSAYLHGVCLMTGLQPTDVIDGHLN